MSFRSRREFLSYCGTSLALPSLYSVRAQADRREVSWLAEVQRVPENLKIVDTGYFEPLLVAEDGSAITMVPQWEVRRAAIRERWMGFLGPMPARPPVRLTTIAGDHSEGCRRLRVRYECEAGVSVEGYLLYPEPLGSTPRPALVVLHSTTNDTIDEVAGLKGRDEQALGLKFARQGFVVFCPQCFLWNDPTLD